MDKFRETLEHCELHDLGFEGDAFTWRNNSHDGTKYIKERLDRVVAMEEWCARFPGARVINEDHRHSDHRPIILEFEEDRNLVVKSGGPRPFRFEAAWMEEDSCREVIRNAWGRELYGREGHVSDANRRGGSRPQRLEP
jgi:hypothetical protein